MLSDHMPVGRIETGPDRVARRARIHTDIYDQI